MEYFEIFAVCRACNKSTVFLIQNKDYDLRDTWSKNASGIVDTDVVLNKYFKFIRYIKLSDINVRQPPEHTPDPISKIFLEGSKCLSIGCWNASSAMFRTSIDVATKTLLPNKSENEDADLKQARKFLFNRINWLVDNGVILPEVSELADCIREDGNDGVHDANLTEDDALDLRDFAAEMFERLYTSPQRLKLADERRKERREPKVAARKSPIK